MVNLYELTEDQLSALRVELPEIANLNLSKNRRTNIAFDRKFHKARVLIIGSMLGFNAFLGFVLLWNIKNALGIDLFDGPHHEIIDVFNQMVGI